MKLCLKQKHLNCMARPYTNLKQMAHQKALGETSLFSRSAPRSSKMNQLAIDSVPTTMKRKAKLLVFLLKK